MQQPTDINQAIRDRQKAAEEAKKVFREVDWDKVKTVDQMKALFRMMLIHAFGGDTMRIQDRASMNPEDKNFPAFKEFYKTLEPTLKDKK